MTTTDQRSEALRLAVIPTWQQRMKPCGDGMHIAYRLDAMQSEIDDLCAELRRLAEENERLKAQQQDFAWPTFADYERDVGFAVNETFKIAWRMARTTNAMLHVSKKAQEISGPVQT